MIDDIYAARLKEITETLPDGEVKVKYRLMKLAVPNASADEEAEEQMPEVGQHRTDRAMSSPTPAQPGMAAHPPRAYPSWRRARRVP